MAQIKTPDISLTGIGNVLAGLALAFLVDNVALDGAVTQMLPAPLVGFIGLFIFAGITVYGYRQAKKLN
jgi:hypothetical protein